MCMDLISKKKPVPEGVGYKAFVVIGGKLYGEFTYKKSRPIGRWLNAQNYSPAKDETGMTSLSGKYKPGWHIFKLRRGVKNWMGNYNSTSHTTRKVKYRFAHTKGIMWDHEVIVAEEIRIIP